jgi:isopropylmalate/homocitrate/citramalate synthase
VAFTICDVGPRDGLQNEREVLPPETRADLVDRLAAAGLQRIEAVSFVRDDRVPQMAGAEEVVAGIDRVEGVVYAGLVLNERGYDRLAATGLDEVHVAFAATE